MRKIFGRIPPVGNPITIKTSDEIPVFPGSLKTYFLNSGTAALAAGLQIAQQHCKAKNPEVIIPAYCCPDLLSAILYNNMKPVLVDFIPDKPYMDLDSIEEALNENTVAVIAVNFLGIPERLKEIKTLLADRPTLLIEDSAQWFPESDEAFEQHQGDLVVYSFGKGKPVSVLGGGALQVRFESRISPSTVATAKKYSIPNNTMHSLKLAAYNIMISKYAYWALELVPFMDIGATIYHPLKAIQTIDETLLPILNENIHCYQTNNFNQQKVMQSRLQEIQFAGIDLPSTLSNDKDRCLLRYPILFENGEAKRKFMQCAANLGLGASSMYPSPLANQKDIPAGAKLTNFQSVNAQSFCDRLSTLPIHDGVSSKVIDRCCQLLKDFSPVTGSQQ